MHLTRKNVIKNEENQSIICETIITADVPEEVLCDKEMTENLNILLGGNNMSKSKLSSNKNNKEDKKEKRWFGMTKWEIIIAIISFVFKVICLLIVIFDKDIQTYLTNNKDWFSTILSLINFFI